MNFNSHHFEKATHLSNSWKIDCEYPAPCRNNYGCIIYRANRINFNFSRAMCKRLTEVASFTHKFMNP